MENTEIDQLDRQILAKLAADGKTPYTDLAKQLFVSSGTIHVRMRKLEQMGVVKGASLVLDYHKLGYTITAFLGIYLERSALYEQVAGVLEQIPEVAEANYVTGPFNMLVKIICRNTDHLHAVLRDKIQQIPGVQRTETFVSLENTISRNPDFLAIEQEKP